jgi:uncharacterized protein YabE (DUF348 family)
MFLPVRIIQMKKLAWTVLALLLLLPACQSKTSLVTILVDGQVYSLNTSLRVPAEILAGAGVSLDPSDRLLYLGSSIPQNIELPDSRDYVLTIRRAVPLTLDEINSPPRVFQTSAATIGQALAEAGIILNAGDLVDPPSETPITGAITVTYRPGREISISVDGSQVRVRSAATTVGQVLAEAGVPLVGLDFSQPSEFSSIPVDGQIHLVRVTETVTLNENSIPYNTRTELSADVEIDQQALVQGGQPGLAITRHRARREDGVQVSQQNESESIVRPPQDRVMGIGTKIVIRTTTVDGETFQYYRALQMYTTSYSPCRSATKDGSCSYGTSSGLPVQRGTVAMVYSWYLAFGFDKLYIPGYGFATVGDVGAGDPSKNPYWVDLAWTDEGYQPMEGWTTVYFLAPVPQNLVYVLP